MRVSPDFWCHNCSIPPQEWFTGSIVGDQCYCEKSYIHDLKSPNIMYSIGLRRRIPSSFSHLEDRPKLRCSRCCSRVSAIQPLRTILGRTGYDGGTAGGASVPVGLPAEGTGGMKSGKYVCASVQLHGFPIE